MPTPAIVRESPSFVSPPMTVVPYIPAQSAIPLATSITKSRFVSLGYVVAKSKPLGSPPFAAISLRFTAQA
ncbi:MAG: hypothetical protein QXQ54_05760 [Thermoplasmata archaeon]